MLVQSIDRSVLGTVRFLDAITGIPIRDRLSVTAPGIRLIRNRSGDFVIADVLGNPNLQAYCSTFVHPTGTPDLELESVSIQLQVVDPTLRYLPRQRIIRLPRNSNPATENSLFQPVAVQLYRSPIAQTAPGWGVLRATVVNQSSNERLPWALIRVVQSSPANITLAQADWRGEALIAVPGIPIRVSATGTDSVLTNEVNVTLEVLFDRELQPISATADLSSLTDPNPNYVPDPDYLEATKASIRSGSLTYSLASGRDRSATLAVSLS
ncbi:hypothetical protein AB3R30_07320 [Leptolyngbyaceae cyanobacterium UHCC 1019]